MGPYGIFQFKQPFLFPDGGTAEINRRFDAHILNLFAADHLFDVDPEQLMLFIFHPQAQRADLSGGTAHGYHIHRIHFLLHDLTFLSCLHYSTFVRI